MIRSRFAFGLVSVLVALAALRATATEESSGLVTPELLPDPEVMKIIDGLGDGECAVLPRFKVAGDLNDEARRWKLDKNGPGSRDYCIKMAWMPERNRAIFYGANHGAPHRLNDVWEYDLPSNTWYCLYGPDRSKGNNPDDWADVDRESDETKTGIIRTKRGGPAIVPHTWWNMTYDPGLKAMLTPCSWSMSDKQLFTLLQKGKHKPPLWAFYPEKKRWEPITGATGDLPGYENARQMEYVPELGATVWTQSGGMYLYDSKANTWKKLGSSKDYGKDLSSREAVMGYVPERKVLVAHNLFGKGAPSKGYEGSRTCEYSVAENKWKTTFSGTGPENPPAGYDAVTNFTYDPVGKVCLMWDASWTKSLWAYDPATFQWTKLAPKGPPPPGGRDAKLAYYDVDRNVLVVNGSWAYRHKKRVP